MRKFITLLLAGLALGITGPAYAASPTGANAPVGGTVGRAELTWTKSGCAAGTYKPQTIAQWNMAGGQAPGTVRFQTMWPNGHKSPPNDVTDSNTAFNVAPTTLCYTATTKTQITRLSDGAKWCVYLVADGANVDPGTCSGF